MPINKIMPKAKIEDAKIMNYTSMNEVPVDMMIPGEFEELKAVIVTWPYNVDEDGNYVELLFEEQAFLTVSKNMSNHFSFPDVLEDSPFPPLFLSMIDGIQQAAEVWIAVAQLKDSVEIKAYAEQQETPLTNCKFYKGSK